MPGNTNKITYYKTITDETALNKTETASSVIFNFLSDVIRVRLKQNYNTINYPTYSA